MAYKYTMLFEERTNPSNASLGARIAGWSESIYADSIDLPKFAALQQSRAQFVASSCRIVGQRIQQVFPRGRSQSTGNAYAPTVGIPNDYPGLGLFCTIRAAGVNNARRFTLRGIPDLVVVEGEYKPVTGYNYLVWNFLGLLGNGFWKFPGRDLTVQPSPLVSVDNTGLITTGAAHGLAVGDKVRVTNSQDSFGFLVGGTFTVLTVPTAVTAKLQGWDNGATEGGVWLDVTAKVLYAMDPATGEVIRVVNRKPGRPFGGFRGRASKRRAR